MSFNNFSHELTLFQKIKNYDFILQKINWLVDRSYGTQGTLEDFFA